MKSHNKAQSMLEYLVILAAIIGIVIAAMGSFAAHDKTIGMGKVADSAGNMIINATAQLPR